MERYLGVIHGNASGRAVAVVRAEVERLRRARTPEVEVHRERLAARRPPLALRRRTPQGYTPATPDGSGPLSDHC